VTPYSPGGEYQSFDGRIYLQFRIYLFEAAGRCVIYNRLEDYDLSQPCRLHCKLRQGPQKFMSNNHHISVAQEILSVMAKRNPTYVLVAPYLSRISYYLLREPMLSDYLYAWLNILRTYQT